MPGIFGLITKMSRQWAEPQLQRMVEPLRHESFYGAGTSVDGPLGVYVGWTVRKKSFSDGMPLCNERGDVSLIFSGEEFPEPGTARRLKERGHSVAMDGPSYLVHLYEEDPAFPAGLNGSVHGSLTAGTLEQTPLFNDRYGLQRIYYHESKDAFILPRKQKPSLRSAPNFG